MATTKPKSLPATRAALVGTVIDFSGDEIRFKVLAGNTVFTIINPILGRVIVIELSGVFTVTLPGTVDVINGDYCPALGLNYLWLYCIDTTPAYVASWSVQV